MDVQYEAKGIAGTRKARRDRSIYGNRDLRRDPECEPVTRDWPTITILCIALLLFVSAVSASETQSATDDRTTLRASTAATGSSLVQVGGDTSGAAGQPAWIGLFVLLFGGLLAGLWLVVGLLSALEAIGETRRRPSPSELGPSPNRSRHDEAALAD